MIEALHLSILQTGLNSEPESKESNEHTFIVGATIKETAAW